MFQVKRRAPYFVHIVTMDKIDSEKVVLLFHHEEKQF